MRACAVIITPGSGTGTKTFTGFADADGNFTPKVFIPIGCATINPSISTSWAFAFGFADTLTNVGMTSEELFLFNSFRGGSGGVSNAYSILKFHDQLTFGGTFLTQAYITAIRSGEIDIVFNLNNSPGDSYIMIALGGDDLDYAIVNTRFNGDFSLGFTPVAILNRNQSYSGTSTAGSSTPISYGFATKADGNKGYIAGAVGKGTPTTNVGAQNSTTAYAEIVNPTTVTGKDLSVWGASSFTLIGDSDATATLALGGIEATSGGWQAPASDGTITIDTTINRKLVILFSTGAAANGVINTPTTQIMIGVIDNNGHSYCFWVGESTTGDDNALNGARIISNTKAALTGTPNGGSTTFANNAVGSFNGNTSFRLAFTGTDSNQPRGFWVALGDTAPPSSSSGGLYKIVPDKTNDTIYINGDGDTEIVAIPNVFAETGFIGDEE